MARATAPKKKVSKGWDKRAVWENRKTKTRGGLTRDDLMMNKRGRIVSKRKHEAGKKLYAKYKDLLIKEQGILPCKRPGYRFQC